MTFLKKLFGGNGAKEPSPSLTAPVEPVFPEEKISAGKVEFEEGIGFVIVNEAYNNYPNKKFFPWCAQITFEYKETNELGLPSDEEAAILNDMEDKIEAFLKQKHKVHFIGRVTRKDYRELIYYIDQPKFDQKETGVFLDQMNEIRNLNFSTEKDATWSFVSGLIKQ